MKNVFITGAAGFIGFHMAKHLALRGDKVLGFDNFNSYYDTALKRERARELEKMGIYIIPGDIQNFSLLQQSIESHRTTHLLHLAAQAGVRHSLKAPRDYLQSNIDGFLNILEVCRLHPHIPLIYASSSSVYGLNQKIPFGIDDRTDRQASLYGVTKKTNELMAHSYHHLFGLSLTGLRFFTVYGPWGRPDMAYFSFAKNILNGDPIEIYNHGNMERDFTYIDDVVAGTAAALDLSHPFAIFNLGNNKPQTVIDLISCLEKELGCKAVKRFSPIQPGDVLSTYADIEESKKQLNFCPKVSLEEGIAHFARWFKEYHS